MARYRVRTLGPLTLTSAAGEAPAIRRRPLSLLVYLARRAPRTVPRAELAALFWGDRTEERARQSLRQALAEIKQALGDVVEATAATLRIVDGVVELDVTDFERDAASGNLEQAAERWTGDFFEDAEALGSDGFDHWIASERVVLHRRLGVVMSQLVDAKKRLGNWAAASMLAERWAAAIPLDEEAHAQVIEALGMQGRSAEALDRHTTFIARHQAELEEEPSEGFVALGRTLGERARAEARRKEQGSIAVRTPDLVGRTAVLAELTAVWRAARAGRATVVLVEGGAGAGKSRLCAELVRHAGAEAQLLRTGAKAAIGDSPAEPYATARALLAGLRDAPGTAGASPEALAEIGLLVPSLAAQFDRLPPRTGEPAAIARAVVEIIAAVADEQPVLLAVDDVHDADEMSQRLLVSVAAQLSGAALLLMLASEEEREPRVTLDQVLGVPGVRRVTLRSLAVHEVEAMIGSMLDMRDDERTQLAAKVHAETLGVPFHTFALVAALVDDGLLVSDAKGLWHATPAMRERALPLPVAVREHVAARLERLGAPARELLDVAAVLGPTVDGVAWERTAGLSHEQAAEGLRELTSKRIVAETSEGGRYEFTRPVVQRVANALLPPTRRADIQSRTAREAAAASRPTGEPPLATAVGEAPPAGPVVPLHHPGADSGSPRRVATRRRALTLGAVAAAVVLIAAALVSRRTSDGPVPSRVLVAPFENHTANPALDVVGVMTADYITQGLSQTGLVSVVPAYSPRGSQTPSAGPAPAARLKTLAEEVGAGTIVSGGYYLQNDSLRIQALITTAPNGRVIRSIDAIAPEPGAPMAAVQKLRQDVLGAFAAMSDADMADWATKTVRAPRYEAFVEFAAGVEAAARGEREVALGNYARAIALDSTFTLAGVYTVYALRDLNRYAEAESLVRVLDRRQLMLSPLDRAQLDQTRALVRGDVMAEMEAAKREVQLAPTAEALVYYAATALRAGRVDEALDALRRSRPTSDRNLRLAADRTTEAYHILGDHHRELQEARRARERLGATIPVLMMEARALAALGRVDEITRRVDEGMATSVSTGNSVDDVIWAASRELRAHGHPQAARELAERGVAWYRGQRSDAAGATAHRRGLARALYQTERWDEVRAIMTELAGADTSSSDDLGWLGVLAARQGDSASAARLARRIADIRSPYLKGSRTMWRADIAALLGHRDEALGLVRQALAEGHGFSIYLHSDPDLESLRGHPEFEAILRPKR